jgi:AraC family transcriptional regulator
MQLKVLKIKGMVCQRCIASVKESFEELGISVYSIHLGEVLMHRNTSVEMNQIAEKLQQLGFSLVTDKKQLLIEEIKALVAEVYSGEFDFPQNFRFSVFVSEILNTPYSLISAVFSGQTTVTLEKYVMGYRIEKIKEFLIYTDNTLDDIAFMLGFSSKAHLASQFKLFTGQTTSHFKNSKSQKATLISNQ